MRKVPSAGCGTVRATDFTLPKFDTSYSPSYPSIDRHVSFGGAFIAANLITNPLLVMSYALYKNHVAGCDTPIQFTDG